MNEQISEKEVLDEKDFEFMAWQDTRVHAISFCPEKYELGLDIDYITQRVGPAEHQNQGAFFLAPASMYFENASGVEINVKLDSVYELSIAQMAQTYIRRSPSDKYEVWKYEIGFHDTGSIILEASGFKLYLRRIPIHTGARFFSLEERGGVSFGRTKIAT